MSDMKQVRVTKLQNTMVNKSNRKEWSIKSPGLILQWGQTDNRYINKIQQYRVRSVMENIKEQNGDELECGSNKKWLDFRYALEKELTT